METAVSVSHPRPLPLNPTSIQKLTKNRSEEEDPDEYAFPLTLRTKRSGPGSPLDGVQLNGN